MAKLKRVFRPEKKELPPIPYPADFTSEEIELCESVRPYSVSTPERIYALIHSMRHLPPGVIVECGVYKGGGVMAMAKILLEIGDLRHFYLYDTFAGMPKPTEEDVDLKGYSALKRFEKERVDDESSHWLSAPLEEVKANILTTGYPESHLHFIKGPVEKTLPAQAPEEIAFLRLDTDWYSSTKHELNHLYPRLVQGGILIIDDYGHFRGARQATDEFFADNPILLTRLDYSARLGIKP